MLQKVLKKSFSINSKEEIYNTNMVAATLLDFKELEDIIGQKYIYFKEIGLVST